MRPVKPGDPLLPALTAQWYNDTLKTINNLPPPRKKQRIPREGLIYCKVDDNSVSAESYTPVAIRNILADGPEVGPPILEVTNDFFYSLSTGDTLGIAQEPVEPGATILCCFIGISKLRHTTLAWREGRGIVYDHGNISTDPTRNHFSSTRGAGWRQIGSQDGFNIVIVSPHEDCNRVRGTLTSALLETDSTGTITNLLGINAPSLFLDDPLTVSNPHNYSADSGALVRAEWVYGNNAWEIYQVSC